MLTTRKRIYKLRQIYWAWDSNICKWCKLHWNTNKSVYTHLEMKTYWLHRFDVPKSLHIKPDTSSPGWAPDIYLKHRMSTLIFDIIEFVFESRVSPGYSDFPGLLVQMRFWNLCFATDRFIFLIKKNKKRITKNEYPFSRIRFRNKKTGGPNPVACNPRICCRSERAVYLSPGWAPDIQH